MAPHCDRGDRGGCQERVLVAKNSGGPVVESHPGPGPHTDPLLNVPERGPTPPVSIVQTKKLSHQEDHMTDLMSVADVRVKGVLRTGSR